MQPKPEVPYIFRDNWLRDQRCSFVGPSSIFQRWNLNMRLNSRLYGLSRVVDETFHIVLVVRSVKSTDNSTKQQQQSGSTESTVPISASSRIFANEKEIITSLQVFAELNSARLTVTDLSARTTQAFEKQLEVISTASLVIGMHGTGIAATVHMPVGHKNCCGVIEIMPPEPSEFHKIHGFGNMIRRLGAHYARLDIQAKKSSSAQLQSGIGSVVPVNELEQLVAVMHNRIVHNSSCILSSVVKYVYM
jgi:hypothetical protein